ncbi:hypothetical protein KSP40_PGU018529 [Platanthera guangdongensis]|uniref:Uncharacterized protein n=1 Tax=Platanthera guangdongensis TaxID=2320717 RepID=A0ABR2LCG2_9ASPA
MSINCSVDDSNIGAWQSNVKTAGLLPFHAGRFQRALAKLSKQNFSGTRGAGSSPSSSPRYSHHTYKSPVYVSCVTEDLYELNHKLELESLMLSSYNDSVHSFGAYKLVLPVIPRDLKQALIACARIVADIWCQSRGSRVADDRAPIHGFRLRRTVAEIVSLHAGRPGRPAVFLRQCNLQILEMQ